MPFFSCVEPKSFIENKNDIGDQLTFKILEEKINKRKQPCEASKDMYT